MRQKWQPSPRGCHHAPLGDSVRGVAYLIMERERLNQVMAWRECQERLILSCEIMNTPQGSRGPGYCTGGALPKMRARLARQQPGCGWTLVCRVRRR